MYSYLWVWTVFSAADDLNIIGNGSGYTKLNRFGVQLNWKLWSYQKYIRLEPYARIDYEHNDVQIKGLTNSYNRLPSPDNNYDCSVFVETYEGGQILPSIGVRISSQPWWRLYFYFDTGYSIGHKTHQRLYFDYRYKGIEQPRAEWHSQGSGRFESCGIGILLWNTKE